MKFPKVGSWTALLSIGSCWLVTSVQTHGKALRDEEQVKLNLELSHIICPRQLLEQVKIVP